MKLTLELPWKLLMRALVVVIIWALLTAMKDHTPKLDTVWITWADDHMHGTVYYGYSSGNKPDSVLHVCKGWEFTHPTGETYNCFKVPTNIDSIVHVDYWDDYHGPDTLSILKQAQKKEKIIENYWAGGSLAGPRDHLVGWKYSDFKECGLEKEE